MPEQGAQVKRGLLLVAHGSVVQGAEQDLLALAERLRVTGQETDRTQDCDVVTDVQTERLCQNGQETDRVRGANFAVGERDQGSDVAIEAEASALVGASDESLKRVGTRLFDIVEVGFLSGTSPSLAEAVHSCAAKGVTELVVMPYFLTAGFLARKAVQVVEREAQNYEGLQLLVAAPLGPHPKLLDVVLDRIEEADVEAD